MISVTQALDALFALTSVLETETVPLMEAAGRTLARDVTARRTQPPFPASAMDGYAVANAVAGAEYTVIGEAAAGARFDGEIGQNEAVRIFTGAPVPPGATQIVIQEDVIRTGSSIVVNEDFDLGPYIRPAGTDFSAGHMLPAPRVLSAQDVALLAAMNIPDVPVVRQPRVAIISTGDELVMPGETPGPDQIIASNTFGLHALLQANGAVARILPIARDNEASLTHAFGLVGIADLVLTIGGASVGDHDLVAPVADTLGMARAFHKVAMRPGKPLMSGRLGDAMMIGLPGNPVSAMVCGHVFVLPVIRAMLGQGQAPAQRYETRLLRPITANGPREHYMRASLTPNGISALSRQDSSLLSVLGAANALLVRPPHDPERDAGDTMQYLPL